VRKDPKLRFEYLVKPGHIDPLLLEQSVSSWGSMGAKRRNWVEKASSHPSEEKPAVALTTRPSAKKEKVNTRSRKKKRPWYRISPMEGGKGGGPTTLI